MRVVSTVCAVIVLLSARFSLGAIPTLTEVPKSESAIGDAFVEAWLSFRGVLDSTAHGRVHPALLEAWFRDIPSFLARDAATLSKEPQVLLAAAERIARFADAEDLVFLKTLEEKLSGSVTAQPLVAIRIKAGDRKTLGEVKGELGSSTGAMRLKAAKILTMAGKKSGIEYLEQVVKNKDDGEKEAARILGRYGPKSSLSVLRSATEKSSSPIVIKAAVGEMLMREFFLDHHRMLVRRDPTDQRFAVTEGLYDEWLMQIGSAIDKGVRDSKSMLSFVESVRQAAPKGDLGEVRRRRLKAFKEFWEQVDAMMAFTASVPSWPTSFTEAMSAIETPKGHFNSPSEFEKRVSSAISICTFAAKRLRHEKRAELTKGLVAISPNGKRAIDGNFATTWMGLEGQQLILEFDVPTTVNSIWLANSCAEEAGPRIAGITVKSAGESSWSVTGELTSRTRYLQQVKLLGKTARRLIIMIDGKNEAQPFCISELRFD